MGKPSPETVAGPPSAAWRISRWNGHDTRGSRKKLGDPGGGAFTQRPLGGAMGAATGFRGVHAIEPVIDAVGAEGVGVDHTHVGER